MASVMTTSHATASSAEAVKLVCGTGARVWRDNASLRAVERSPVRGEQAFAEELDFLEKTFASARPTLSGIDELGGYSPVALRDWQEVTRRFSGTPDVLFRMFNVCWVVSAAERPWPSRHGFELVAELWPRVVLLRYRGCLPRAWVAPELEVVTTRDAVLERMARPDFDPSVTTVLEATTAAQAPAPVVQPTALVRRQRRAHHKVATEKAAQGTSLCRLPEAKRSHGESATKAEAESASAVRSNNSCASAYVSSTRAPTLSH